MITDSQLDDLYKIAIKILKDKVNKKRLKDKLGWYNTLNHDNQIKMTMICDFLIENA